MFDRKEHYKLNRDKQIALANAWRKANPERIKLIRKNQKEKLANNVQKSLVARAKDRARRDNIPCTISESDIDVPLFCPVLGIELKRIKGKRNEYSPSLDRVIPKLGYVPGNVKVISWRANRIKCDASLEELERVVKYCKEHYQSEVLR